MVSNSEQYRDKYRRLLYLVLGIDLCVNVYCWIKMGRDQNRRAANVGQDGENRRDVHATSER